MFGIKYHKPDVEKILDWRYSNFDGWDPAWHGYINNEMLFFIYYEYGTHEHSDGINHYGSWLLRTCVPGGSWKNIPMSIKRKFLIEDYSSEYSTGKWFSSDRRAKKYAEKLLLKIVKYYQENPQLKKESLLHD